VQRKHGQMEGMEFLDITTRGEKGRENYFHWGPGDPPSEKENTGMHKKRDNPCCNKTNRGTVSAPPGPLPRWGGGPISPRERTFGKVNLKGGKTELGTTTANPTVEEGGMKEVCRFCRNGATSPVAAQIPEWRNSIKPLGTCCRKRREGRKTVRSGHPDNQTWGEKRRYRST